MHNTLRIIIICSVSVVFLIGCSTTSRTTNSSRTTVEQLLISEAVTRSLSDKSDKTLPIPAGSKLSLNTSSLTEDKTLLQEVLTGWLGQQGYLVQKDEKNATYRVDVIVGALGTEAGGTFFGLPPIQSQIIPFSLSELAFYKSENQTGYVKFKMNVFEITTGKFIGSMSNFLADSYYNNYTIFLVFSYTSTDLMSPPQLGYFFRSKPQNAEEIQSEEKLIFDWW